MKRPSQRSALLQATSEVVREQGAASLTLDAVAARSGASKGGVLYHFPTKTILIGALIESEIEAFEAAISEALASGRPGRGAFARAYARASVDGAALAGAGLAGILAAVANDESVLDSYRSKTVEWRARMLDDGLDPSTAELIRMASDGLYYNAAIGAALPRAEDLGALLDRLAGLASEEPR